MRINPFIGKKWLSRVEIEQITGRPVDCRAMAYSYPGTDFVDMCENPYDSTSAWVTIRDGEDPWEVYGRGAVDL